MSSNPKQRLTLTDLKEPQQMRELNRQLTWIWDQLLGGLSMKSLNTQTQEVINSKAESASVDDLEKRTSELKQTADGIKTTVAKLTVGGTNLLRDSKELKIGQTADDWRVTGSNLVTRYGNASGFYRFKLTNSGQTENGGWVSASSPLARLPDGWYGKEVTLTAWIWSENWAAVDAGITWSVCLSQGGTARINWGDKYSIVVPGKAELGADAKSDTALANSKWVRVSTTFRLDEDGAGSGDGDLRANTHIFARFYLRRNGEYRIYAPMMEFGNLAGDWSPAPEDVDGKIGLIESELSTHADAIKAKVSRYDTDGNLINYATTEWTEKLINSLVYDDETGLQTQISQTAGEVLILAQDKADKGVLDTGDDGAVRVRITKDEFDVDVPGEDGDFTLNEAGAKVPVLIANDVSAPNVTPRYTGASTLYVNPNATSAQIAAGNYFRSLADALAKLNGKWLPYSVTIAMQAGSEEQGVLQVRGMAGNGQIIINGNGSKLTGQMLVNLMAVPVTFNGLNVDVSANGYGFDVGNGSVYAQIKNCIINGRGSGWGVRSAQGSQVTVNTCELYGLTRSLYTQYGGRLYGEGNKGDCVAASASGGFMSLTGTQPCHQTTWTAYKANAGQVFTEGVTVDMGTATPPVAEPTTAEFSMLHADTYAGGYESSWNYQSHDDIMQGYTEHAGRIFGCIWFDNSAIRAAGIKTVKQAALRLTAQKYVGRGVSVEVHLWGTATEYTGRSGAPALTVDYGVIGTAAPGETTTITIPAQAAADLASGAINALMLYSDDTGLYKDRNYSKNYMRFDGGTKGDAGTRPVLTVVYQ